MIVEYNLDCRYINQTIYANRGIERFNKLVVDNHNNLYFFEYEEYLDELKKTKKIIKNCTQCGSSIKNSKIFCQYCNQKLCSKCKIEIEIPELFLKSLKSVCEECAKTISNTNKIFYEF